MQEQRQQAHQFAAGGQYPLAIKLLRQLLGDTPKDVELWLDLAHCYLELHEFPRAKTCFARILGWQPRHKECWFGLAVISEATQNWQQAISNYQEVLKIDARFTPAQHNLAGLYLRLGFHEPAARLFEQLQHRNPTIVTMLGFAIAMDRMGKSEEAIRGYRNVLAKRPQTRHRPYIEERLSLLVQEQPRHRLVRIK